MSNLYQTLLQTQAVMFRLDPPFTFSSGLVSPIYCDNRRLMSDPATRQQIVDAFCQSIPKHIKQIAGVATAGISWAAWIAQQLDISFIYVRPEPKKHGAKKQIEGIPRIQPTWVIEDLISTGGSSLKACQVMRDQDIPIEGLSAIFSYGFDHARRQFDQASIEVQTLMNITELLPIAIQNKFISDAQAEKVVAWQKSPDHWAP